MKIMRNKLSIAAVSLFLVVATTRASAEDVPNASDIVIACEQLLADYAIYRDHMNAEAWANTFSEDGELVLSSGSHRGRAAILKNIRSRPVPAVAHMVMLTTVKITPHSETAASGIAYAIVLNGDRPVNKGDKPIQMAGITSAVEYHTDFELTDDGWKIKKLLLKSVFRGPGVAQPQDAQTG